MFLDADAAVSDEAAVGTAGEGASAVVREPAHDHAATNGDATRVAKGRFSAA